MVRNVSYVSSLNGWPGEAQKHLFIENVTHSCNLINHSEGTGGGEGNGRGVEGRP